MTEGRTEELTPISAQSVLPWHVKAWSALTRDLNALPHALLLHGAEGLGKRVFARRLVGALLCTATRPGSDECGICASCRLLKSGAHPDLELITPTGESRVISIDQVRAVREFVALRPHTSTRKVVLLEPAESMNLSSANALLKVLEEPPESSMLILITSQPARLAATVRSRCAHVPFQPPGTAEAVDWLSTQGLDKSSATEILRLAGGGPLRALEMARTNELNERAEWLKDVECLRAGRGDPIECATKWKGYGASRCLDWFQRYVAATVSDGMTAAKIDRKVKSMTGLFNYLDVLYEAKALTNGPLDETLLLEDILIAWTRLFRPVV